MKETQSGFTLIETLVSLSLLSLLTLLLFGGMIQLRALPRLSSDNDRIMELTSIADYLTEEISDARQLPLIKDNIDRQIVFRGTASAISFVARTRIGSQQFGLRDIDILGVETSGELDVYESEILRRAGASDPSSRVLLGSKIAGLRFEYLAADDRTHWAESWQHPGRMPAAVRFHIEFVRQGHRYSVTRTAYPAGPLD